MDDNQIKLKEKFISYFHYQPSDFIRAFGRLEIIGNHTDHNHGLAIVAGASLFIKSAVKKANDVINLFSEGHDKFIIDVKKSKPVESEFSTTNALIKGIVNRFIDLGYNVGGFDAYCVSEVIAGSGISSSAAFEVLVCEILNHLYNNDQIEKITIAKISQYAEKVYFGKPCGLLDQIGASFGGISYVDFYNPDEPVIENLKFPFDLKIVLTNPGGSHAGLDSYYASIPLDMRYVCKLLGVSYLRDSSYEKLESYLCSHPKSVDEIKINRAKHFYYECKRVQLVFDAIRNNDINAFIKCINESGLSSSRLLMNTLVPGRYDTSPERALEIARKVAPKSGHRIHGGGFAGTIISFCYNDEYQTLIHAMQETFGPDSTLDITIPSFSSGAY